MIYFTFAMTVVNVQHFLLEITVICKFIFFVMDLLYCNCFECLTKIKLDDS